MPFRAGWGTRAATFDPVTNPALIDGWDALRNPLPNGAMANWVSVLGSVATVAAGGPNAIATGIVDDAGGTHPGVQMVNTRLSLPLGAKLAGRTKIGVVASLQVYGIITAVLLESDPLFTANGKFGLTLNNIAQGDAGFAAFGGGNFGQWLSPTYTYPVDGTTPLPFVLSGIYDLSDPAGVGSTSHRMDNVETLGGTTPATNLVAGSTFVNVPINFGGRNDATPLFPTY
jgi:hypothetical protein